MRQDLAGVTKPVAGAIERRDRSRPDPPFEGKTSAMPPDPSVDAGREIAIHAEVVLDESSGAGVLRATQTRGFIEGEYQ